ncbi:hypothetical protein MNBD_GAMMA23-459 [hydrothermal vent metagenome]|uniref:Mercuric resistance operon regulatory protein n=1 Tax=hydrothermal vent metagenome TaxID=652676 RepID=A0A3B1A686_9ZZZZ
MAKPLTIGQLARQAGVNIETIRYYQRLGIINEPKKPEAGYRIYPQESVERILFIRRAKQLGFSLKEIAELLELGDGHCDDVRQRAEDKQTQIAKQIQDLQNLQQTLGELIKSCQQKKNNTPCPIVEALSS